MSSWPRPETARTKSRSAAQGRVRFRRLALQRHFYYRFDRARLLAHAGGTAAQARGASAAVLDPAGAEAPVRMQSFVVSGQKADFGLLTLDPDPLVIDRLHHRLMAGPCGAALEPAWSFVS